MNKSFFERIQNTARYLNLDLSVKKMVPIAVDIEFSEENIQAVAQIFTYL